MLIEKNTRNSEIIYSFSYFYCTCKETLIYISNCLHVLIVFKILRSILLGLRMLTHWAFLDYFQYTIAKIIIIYLNSLHNNNNIKSLLWLVTYLFFVYGRFFFNIQKCKIFYVIKSV